MQDRIGAAAGTSRTRAAAATFVGNAANLVVVASQAVLLVPLYIRALGPDLYGAWLATGEVLVWLQAIDLGLPNLMIQRIAQAHGREDRESSGSWFISGCALLGMTSLAVFGLGLILAPTLPTWFRIAPQDAAQLSGPFVLATSATALNIFANGAVALGRAVQRTGFLSVVMVAAGVIGLVTSLTLVLQGWGLWAIAVGIAARAAVNVVGCAAFVASVWRREVRGGIRADVVRELMRSAPVTALGGIAYAVMSQSEIFLVAVLIGPREALVYGLTRRLADVGRNFVDMIGFATYGPFAHLVSSAQREHSSIRYRQILSMHLTAAVAVASAYVAMNHSFVAAWVGEASFGGVELTTVMGIQAVVLGHSYLVNYLYRATGPVVTGSLILVVEACTRVVLGIVLLVGVGVIALPIGSALVAGVTAVVLRIMTRRRLSLDREAVRAASWVARLGVLGAGALAAQFLYLPRWPAVVIGGSLALLLAGGTLIAIDGVAPFDELISRGLRRTPALK